MRRNLRLAAALVVSLASGASHAAEAPPGVVTCNLIAQAAVDHDLPVSFFTRLIWQESAFRADAVSPAGAQGIAQFMPQTAAEKGLNDPFERQTALVKSAAYLAELRSMFGNLGLAAAGYNAGPGRVARWLRGDLADLPQETRDYVRIVTGQDVDAWKTAGSDKPQPIAVAAPREAALPAAAFSCLRFAAKVRRSPGASGVAGAGFPSAGKRWAVILVGSLRRDSALSEYQIVRAQYAAILSAATPSVVHKRIAGSRIARFVVQIERESRSGADDLCKRLQRAGGACFVLANR